jgi:hypothetical protein
MAQEEEGAGRLNKQSSKQIGRAAARRLFYLLAVGQSLAARIKLI